MSYAPDWADAVSATDPKTTKRIRLNTRFLLLLHIVI